MDFDFSDDQEQLRDAVRKWVDKGYDFERRRKAAEDEAAKIRAMMAAPKKTLVAKKPEEAKPEAGKEAIKGTPLEGSKIYLAGTSASAERQRAACSPNTSGTLRAHPELRRLAVGKRGNEPRQIIWRWQFVVRGKNSKQIAFVEAANCTIGVDNRQTGHDDSLPE